MTISRASIDQWVREEKCLTGDSDVKADVDWKVMMQYQPGDNGAALKLHLLAKQNRLFILAPINFAPEHRKALNKQGILTKGAVARLRERLLLANIQFSVRMEGTQAAGWVLETTIYADGLTQDRFMSDVRRIYAAFLYVSQVATQVAEGQAEMEE